MTVRLPIYNERHVVARLIDHACQIDYPASLLEVQVLDDSDDSTALLAKRRAAYWQARGVDVVHMAWGTREGFKAGALAEGTAVAKGEYLLVLDADCIAPTGLVRDLLPPFRDETVIHLCGHVARRALGFEQYLLIDLLIFAAATFPFMVFYWSAGCRRGHMGFRLSRGVARTLAPGIGLTVPVTRAVFRGLTGTSDPFVRTPKKGEASGDLYPGMAAWPDLLATYLVLALAGGYWGQLPFILLFTTGYSGLVLPAPFPARGPGVAPSCGERGGGRDALVPDLRRINGEQNEERDPEQKANQNGL